MPSVGLAVSGLLHAAALAAVMLVALPGKAPVAPEPAMVVDLVVLDETPGRAAPSNAGGIEPSPARIEPPPAEADTVEAGTGATDGEAISLETASGPPEPPETVSDGFDVPPNPVADRGQEPASGVPDARLAVVSRFQPPRKPKHLAPPVTKAAAQASTSIAMLPKRTDAPGIGAPKPGPSVPSPHPHARIVARSEAFGGPAGGDAFSAAQPVGGGIANPPPRYPFSARRRGQEGRVVLRVEVDPAGHAADVVVAHSSGFSALDKAAADAVRRWRFQPARRGGAPVAGRIEVPIQFRLNTPG